MIWAWLHRTCKINLAIKEAIIADRLRENCALQTALEGARERWDRLASPFFAEPASLEERVWQALVGYGFTARAQAAVWRHCDLTEASSFDGLPTAYVHGARGTLHLAPTAPRINVAHECLHAAIAWTGHLQGERLTRMAEDMSRLDVADYSPEMRLLARRALQHTNNLADVFCREHVLVYGLHYAKFRREPWPEWFWERWCAPLLTGGVF